MLCGAAFIGKALCFPSQAKTVFSTTALCICELDACETTIELCKHPWVQLVGISLSQKKVTE